MDLRTTIWRSLGCSALILSCWGISSHAARKPCRSPETKGVIKTKVNSPAQLTIVFDSTADGVCSSAVAASVMKTASWQEAERKDGVQVWVEKDVITALKILPDQDIPTIAIMGAEKFGLR